MPSAYSTPFASRGYGGFGPRPMGSTSMGSFGGPARSSFSVPHGGSTFSSGHAGGGFHGGGGGGSHGGGHGGGAHR